MQQFFDPVVDSIDSQIESMLREDGNLVKCLILSGGLGKSEYVNRHIRDKWASAEIKVLSPLADHKGPVPEGALRRYDVDDFESIGETWSLAVIMDEEFDPEIHLDAAANEGLVKGDYINSADSTVENRLTWIYVRNPSHPCAEQH